MSETELKPLNKRLRWHAEHQSIIPSPKMMVEAAEEIDALQEDNARLREALEVFAKCADYLDGDKDVERTPDDEWAKFRLIASDYRKARAALKEGGS